MVKQRTPNNLFRQLHFIPTKQWKYIEWLARINTRINCCNFLIHKVSQCFKVIDNNNNLQIAKNVMDTLALGPKTSTFHELKVKTHYNWSMISLSSVNSKWLNRKWRTWWKLPRLRTTKKRKNGALVKMWLWQSNFSQKIDYMLFPWTNPTGL